MSLVFPDGTFDKHPRKTPLENVGETVNSGDETLRNAKEAQPGATGQYVPGIRWEEINLKYWRRGNAESA